jgi:hypothetical protein
MSGDIGVSGVHSDNSYHVVTVQPDVTGAVIDGFTISDGYANGAAPNGRGAGIFNEGQVTVIDCTIMNCQAFNAGTGDAIHSEGIGEILFKGIIILQN